MRLADAARDVRYGAVGARDSPSPIELIPIDLLRRHRNHADDAVAVTTSGGTDALGAMLVMPEVATLLSDRGAATTPRC